MVYRIQVGEKPQSKTVKMLLNKSVFMYAKVPTYHLIGARALERVGFHLIDTSVVFEKKMMSTYDSSGEVVVRFAQPEDENQVVAVASTSFIYSRFHLDPEIPNNIANTVKTEWVRNYFRGQRGDQMIVALIDNQIVGFNQLLFDQDRILTIDLIAVDTKYHRKGIAGVVLTC